jgi:hypothetical protein
VLPLVRTPIGEHHGEMPEPTVLPVRGEVVADARGNGRALRVSWHPEHGLAVLSVWRGTLCVATVQVEGSEVPHLVDVLVRGLATGSAPPEERPAAV